MDIFIAIRIIDTLVSEYLINTLVELIHFNRKKDEFIVCRIHSVVFHQAVQSHDNARSFYVKMD